MNKKKLIREQLDNKFIRLQGVQELIVPPSGWVFAVRQGLNMSLKQLANRLSITPQSVKEIEEREKRETISIKVLKQVAVALDMVFVYGFMPKEGTLEKMIESRANELARQIVGRTSIHMDLEDQKNSPARIENAIKEKTEELKRETPRFLWD
jgi:predicted DNA-binding mobile mystery protein A